MKATIVISRYDRVKCEDVLEQWTAEEILPAQHQTVMGNGKYLLIKRPNYTSLCDVRMIPHFSIVTYLLDNAKSFYGKDLHSTIITNFE